MLFSLSWRWLRWWCVCYAWCMLRAPFGAALRSGAIRGGASFVRLASCLRDCFGSPRLEPEFLPLHLGFHFATKGYPIGDLGVHWTLPWTLPWPPCALASSNDPVACFRPSSLLCIRPALSAGPWLRSHCCAL
ncbi:hypothetical protein V6N11_061190 [Hibiscus sabdariffa]|uniref:Secreted protein n=1 Tax=Hibiscus sabdariffa TaxID=183260 RepID=A0ABR1ZZW6_9ROSI